VASSDVAACTAPADYGELFLQFGDDIRRLVWRQLGPGAQRDDADDGVSYIIERLMATGAIEQYDPGRISEFTQRPVKFKAFIMAKVALYCRGLRETLSRRQGRELLVIDSAFGDSESTQGPWEALLAVSDEYPALDGDVLDRLREELAVRENTPGRAPVLPLFDALAERFAAGGRVSVEAMRRKFGMDAEGIAIWFAELREALHDIGCHQETRPVPVQPVPAVLSVPEPEGEFELGGVRLTGAEVAAAAAALRASKGNRVLPAFKDAGHKLAEAGKTWYLDFAERVMRAHPELRTEKGGHWAGGHFGRVKNALIYGLEELAGMLEESQAAEEVPPPEVQAAMVLDGPWQALERVILTLPGFTAESAEAALEAVRLLAAA
jgi:DNA-directed RNA polymerase specialized sigma24 family protein